jgi:hypothetical protein
MKSCVGLIHTDTFLFVEGNVGQEHDLIPWMSILNTGRVFDELPSLIPEIL